MPTLLVDHLLARVCIACQTPPANEQGRPDPQHPPTNGVCHYRQDTLCPDADILGPAI